MFRVDDTVRSQTSCALFGEDERLGYYPFVEAVNNLPVWVVQVVDGDDEYGVLRRILLGELRQALSVLARPQWRARVLYVLLPEYQTKLHRLTSELCLEIAIWVSTEGSQYLRIQTENTVVYDPSDVTPKDGDELRQVLWKAETVPHSSRVSC